MQLISHSKPFITNRDIKSVHMALKRNFIGPEGPASKKIESSFKEYLGRKYCIPVNSGSNALKLCLSSLGLKKGSEIITSVHVCSAVVNVILELCHTPRFVDLEKKGVNIDIQALKRYVESNRNKKAIGAIIIPYIGGYALDIQDIMDLGIPIIEDCASSIGSKVSGKPIGMKGDFSIFSFGSTKMITGGSGGMVLTDSLDHYRNMCRLIRYDDPDTINATKGTCFNCYMNDMQAALISSQFDRLEATLKIRRNIAKKYDELLSSMKNVDLIRSEDNSPSYYRYIFLAKEKDRIIAGLKRRNVDARGSVANFMYRYFKLSRNSFANAVKIENEMVSLPIYPNLNLREQKTILSALNKILTKG